VSLNTTEIDLNGKIKQSTKQEYYVFIDSADGADAIWLFIQSRYDL